MVILTANLKLQPVYLEIGKDPCVCKLHGCVQTQASPMPGESHKLWLEQPKEFPSHRGQTQILGNTGCCPSLLIPSASLQEMKDTCMKHTGSEPGEKAFSYSPIDCFCLERSPT